MPKPVKKKKKFIHKKESTTYRLIPGYVNDEDVTSQIHETSEETETRKEEQRKHGIFFDDTYNYMKHVRSLNEQATLVASYHVGPDSDVQSNSSRIPVFVEHFSTDVTAEDDIDPDVLAALDNAPVVNIADCDSVDRDIDESDDFLDDDFIAAAGGPVPIAHDVDDGSDFHTDEEEDENTDEIDDDGSDVSDEVSSDVEDELSAIPSSQRRGNMQDDIAEAQTALILKNFEEGLGFTYSSQLPEDDGEMPTAEDYENLKQIMKDDANKPMTWAEFLDDTSERPKIDVSKYVYEDDEEEFEWKEVPPRKPKFDCMSVLSLNSNTRNLPTDILPPKTEGKKSHQLSESNSESVSGMSLRQLQAEMRENRKVDKACTFRPKDETVEEKKARKKAIKDERKERRQEKKANKEVFAMENEKMQKEAAALSKSVKSIKIY